MDMDVFRVDLHGKSYNIYIGSGILSTAGALLKEHGVGRKVLLVTCPTVRKLYGDVVETAIKDEGYSLCVVELPDGEATKSLDTLAYLYDQAIGFGCERNSSVIALGGGVIGDVTGLFAATYLRGVPFVQIPTTLLAQVDSSVGGKVAVNHREGKNLIGAFYQPLFVLSDVDTLNTLPHREFLSGLAEVIKYGIICDEPLFLRLEKDSQCLANGYLKDSVDIVAQCCRDKAGVVEEDERETGVRAILNYGHTVGHSIERATGFSHYRHGEAVAIGMVSAALLSQRIGMARDVAPRICRLLRVAGLPVVWEGVQVSEIISGFKYDKKIKDGKVRFVLPQSIGRVSIRDDISESLLRDVLEEQMTRGGQVL